MTAILFTKIHLSLEFFKAVYTHLILRLKFFQSSSGGHVTVTSTSSKILHSLSGLSHPIPRLILSAVRGHLERYSDGGLRTALLLLRCLTYT